MSFKSFFDDFFDALFNAFFSFFSFFSPSKPFPSNWIDKTEEELEIEKKFEELDEKMLAELEKSDLQGGPTSELVGLEIELDWLRIKLKGIRQQKRFKRARHCLSPIELEEIQEQKEQNQLKIKNQFKIEGPFGPPRKKKDYEDEDEEE